MKISRDFHFVTFVLGCLTLCSCMSDQAVHSGRGNERTSVVQKPLTATQAQILAMELANDKAESLFHHRPFHDSRVPQFAEGRWVWTASEGVGHMDVQAKVELAADGSTNSVNVEAFDSGLVR